jgi:fumarate reductase flavoprotein subunit
MTSCLNAQLVVIGGGGAGLAAAVEASERGATDIVVVEKRAGLGGNTALAGGLFACESPVQMRQRINADRDILFRKALDWAHWEGVNPMILRAFINKSGETIGWLEKKGLEFDLIYFYPGQQPPVQHNPEGNGARLVRVLEQECRDKGVTLLLDTAAVELRHGKNREITGVLVEKDGESVEIVTGGAVIATGGFAGNRKLMERYFPDLEGMARSGLPLTGDGLALAAGAGAVIEKSATLLKEGPRYHLHRWPLMALERDPVTVWVNKNGERFTDESTGYHIFESVNAVMRQPGKACFTLLDSSVRRYFEEKGLKLRRAPAAVKDDDVGAELEKAFRAGVKEDRVKIARGWDEIAAWLGADPDVLKNTIAQYNSSCRQGYDELFAKERKYLLPLETAPFYAVRDMAVILDTIGGVRINERMEVLGSGDEAVPGLYAAGVVTGGWESGIYCSELSASAFGFAINSGRIAGENALKYVLSIR